MSDVDVVIVGGRVAGASTALLLAHSGLRVTLLDRGGYGSDTLSTHGLMRTGVWMLDRWGLLHDVIEAKTPPIRQTTFHYADGETVEVALKPTAGVEALYAPRRLLLDRLLVDAAVAEGVEVRHRTTVISLLHEDGRVVGVRARDAEGRDHTIRAAVTVGADGVRSTVAAGVDAPVVWQGRRAGSVLYRYYADLPASGYEWAYGEGVAAGLIPTNDGLTCVFVGTSPERMRALRSTGVAHAFGAVLAGSSPALHERVADGAPVGGPLGWPCHAGVPPTLLGSGLGLGRGRGLLQGPDHHPRHHRRPARRRAARRRPRGRPGGHGRRTGGSRGYQCARDLMSTRLFSATEAIAAYDWDIDRVRTLLRQVSARWPTSSTCCRASSGFLGCSAPLRRPRRKRFAYCSKVNLS